MKMQIITKQNRHQKQTKQSKANEKNKIQNKELIKLLICNEIENLRKILNKKRNKEEKE